MDRLFTPYRPTRLLIAAGFAMSALAGCSDTTEWRDLVRKENPVATQAGQNQAKQHEAGQSELVALSDNPQAITADGTLVPLSETHGSAETQTGAELGAHQNSTMACTVLSQTTTRLEESGETNSQHGVLDSVLGQDPDDVFASPLTAREAEAAYTCIQPVMQTTLAASRHTLRDNFWTWTRVPGAPFVSQAMEDRHTVVYANGRALRLEGSNEQYDRGFPIGATLAAVSFRVTDTGVVNPGPILIIEKMNRSFNSDNGNWRYTQLFPAGDILGITQDGKWVEKVQCPTCRIKNSDLFYLSFLNKGIMPFIDDPKARREEENLPDETLVPEQVPEPALELAPEPVSEPEVVESPLLEAPTPDFSPDIQAAPALVEPPSLPEAPVTPSLDPTLDPNSPVFEPPK